VEVLHLSEETSAVWEDDAVIGDLEPAASPGRPRILLLDEIYPAKAHNERFE
jgi:hypothetical protein